MEASPYLTSSGSFGINAPPTVDFVDSRCKKLVLGEENCDLGLKRTFMIVPARSTS